MEDSIETNASTFMVRAHFAVMLELMLCLCLCLCYAASVSTCIEYASFHE